MKLPFAICLVFASGCASSTADPQHAPSLSAPDPAVDMACVQRALGGKLLVDLPAQAGPFHVTPAVGGVHLHRDGRTLDDADGKRLWDAFSDAFVHGAFDHSISEAGDGMYSVYTCSDVDKRSCIKVQLWVCQLGLAAFADKLASTIDHVGLGDAALSIDIGFLEARGPKCRNGDACTPIQHYSTHGTYLPGAAVPRRSQEAGVGTCKTDGDCEPGGQACMPWYLAGGVSTQEYRQYEVPTFCGCVQHRCRWFQQE